MLMSLKMLRRSFSLLIFSTMSPGAVRKRLSLAGLQRASAAAAEAEAVALLPGGGDRAGQKRSSRRGHSRGGSIGSIAHRAKSGVLYSSILLEEYRE